MIVSLHLPKCGGTTFRWALNEYFKDRLYLDYGDWVGDEYPEAIARRAQRLKDIKLHLEEIITEKDCIHGHFYAPKWLSLLDKPRFFTIFRDPFETVPSGYEFLVRNPQIPQPSVVEFHKKKMTFPEYIAKWENQMTKLLEPLDIGDFEAFGLASRMSEAVMLFNAVFGTEVRLPDTPLNINPKGSNYSLSDEERKLIEKHHGLDIALWQRAVDRYKKDIEKYTL